MTGSDETEGRLPENGGLWSLVKPSREREEVKAICSEYWRITTLRQGAAALLSLALDSSSILKGSINSGTLRSVPGAQAEDRRLRSAAGFTWEAQSGALKWFRASSPSSSGWSASTRRDWSTLHGILDEFPGEASLPMPRK